MSAVFLEAISNCVVTVLLCISLYWAHMQKFSYDYDNNVNTRSLFDLIYGKVNWLITARRSINNLYLLEFLVLWI